MNLNSYPVTISISGGTGVAAGPNVFGRIEGINVRAMVSGSKDVTVGWRIKVEESRWFNTTDRFQLYDTKAQQGDTAIRDQFPARGYVTLNATSSTATCVLQVELMCEGSMTA